MEVTQGNLEPPLVTDIGGAEGDLGDVESWRLVGSRSGTVLFTDTSPGVQVGTPSTQATITHEWVESETDSLGVGDVDVEATWPSGRPQTFTAYAAFKVVPNRGD